MSWSVDWEPSAQQQLAQIWTDANDKAEVTDAADFIDQQLAVDPFLWSESREDGSRIMIEPPLAVKYDVDEQQQSVRVWAVWRWGQSPL